MDFMAGSTERITFKPTVVYDDIASASLTEVAATPLRSSQKLAIVVDYTVGWNN